MSERMIMTDEICINKFACGACVILNNVPITKPIIPKIRIPVMYLYFMRPVEMIIKMVLHHHKRRHSFYCLFECTIYRLHRYRHLVQAASCRLRGSD